MHSVDFLRKGSGKDIPRDHLLGDGKEGEIKTLEKRQPGYILCGYILEDYQCRSCS